MPSLTLQPPLTAAKFFALYKVNILIFIPFEAIL
jgi:hypothetical protein